MRLAIVGLGTLALVGCDLLGQRGDLLATLSVHATLRENTCGTAVGDIPATTELRVDLYEAAGMLTWSGSQGSFLAQIDEEGNFVYQTSGSQTLRAEEPDGWGGVRAACVIEAVEEIRGRLTRPVRPEADGGPEPEEAVPAQVTATDTLFVSPAPGSDCADFVGAAYGDFRALPCTVVLDLDGSEE